MLKVASQASVILLHIKFKGANWRFFCLLFFFKEKKGGDFININPIFESVFSDFEVNKKRIVRGRTRRVALKPASKMKFIARGKSFSYLF